MVSWSSLVTGSNRWVELLWGSHFKQMLNSRATSPMSIKCQRLDVLFYLYASSWWHQYGVFSFHCYADDAQLYALVKPNDLSQLLQLEACLSEILKWMGMNSAVKCWWNADKSRTEGRSQDFWSLFQRGDPLSAGAQKMASLIVDYVGIYTIQ